MRNRAEASTRMVLIVGACALLGLVAPAETQTTAKRYAVKFICGEADGEILARGSYTTAINIQNPNHDPDSSPVTYGKRFAVALPGERVGGTTSLLAGPALTRISHAM